MEETEVKIKIEDFEEGESASSPPPPEKEEKPSNVTEEQRQRKREYDRKRRLEIKRVRESAGGTSSFPPPRKPLTEEQKLRKREYQREHIRKKRAAMKNLKETGRGTSLPPPKIRTEEEKQRNRDNAKQRYWKMKEAKKRLEESEGGGDPPELTEEEREKIERMRQLAAEKERRKRERLREDPERLKEMAKRKSFQDFVKRASMTEEELKTYKLKKYLRYHAWYSQKGRFRNQSEGEKQKKREAFREWRKNLSGEKEKKYQESLRRAQKKYMERLKVQDPEKYGRVYDGGAKHCKGRYEKMRKDPVTWKTFRERQNAFMRKKYATETPEERERRRWKEKVNAARRRLKKKLEEEGWDKDEIERRDEQLKVKMWKEFDPEGEVPGSTPGYRRKKPQQKPVQSPDPSPGAVGGQQVAPDFGCGDDLASPPQSPFSSPGPPSPSPLSPDTTSFPDATQSSLCPVASTPCSRSEPSTENFECPHCSSTFEEDAERRLHIELIHPSKCWKCPKCSEMVLSPVELTQHYNATHKTPTQCPQKEEPPPPFQCMRCPHSSHSVREAVTSKFKSRLELFSHVKTSHPGSYWPCLDCHLLKYSEQSLQIHLTICRPHDAKKKLQILN